MGCARLKWRLTAFQRPSIFTHTSVKINLALMGSPGWPYDPLTTAALS